MAENEIKTMPTAEEIGKATARAALYAADNEADALSADYPDAYKSRIPARGTVSGESRLAKVLELAPHVERVFKARQNEKAAEAALQSRVEEQRARNVRRHEEAAHFQQWQKNSAGKAYVPLHKDLDLTPEQLRNLKPLPPASKADARPRPRMF